MTTGFLVLEDGSVYRGRSVAAEGVAFGEAVFTTGMTGYQARLPLAGSLFRFGQHGQSGARATRNTVPWLLLTGFRASHRPGMTRPAYLNCHVPDHD